MSPTSVGKRTLTALCLTVAAALLAACNGDSSEGVAGTLSLESLSTPGHYIRHRNFEVWLDANDGSAVFAGDASFRVQPALVP